MTNKEKIQNLVDRMPDDISFDEAVYRMVFLKQVEQGLQDARGGRTIDHDELFDKLLSKHEANQAALVGKSGAKLARDQKLHRAGRPRNGRFVPKPAKAGRK